MNLLHFAVSSVLCVLSVVAIWLKNAFSFCLVRIMVAQFLVFEGAVLYSPQEGVKWASHTQFWVFTHAKNTELL